ncbi:hypothetical protein OQA88_11480 [Cercophora sp. LCS_1]
MSSLWNHRHATTTPGFSSHTSPGFSSLFRMLDDFDRYAQDAIGSPAAQGLRSFSPKFDVTEHEKNFVLQGELAGVPPENVVIEFTDPQTMVVRGHVEKTRTEGDPAVGRIEGEEGARIEAPKGEGAAEGEKKDTKVETKKAKYWLSERSFGEFSRVFNFPGSVDQEGVTAKFEHGVLNITVPKVEKKGARRIEIKAN